MTRPLDPNELLAVDEYQPQPFDVELDLYRRVDMNLIQRQQEKEPDHE